MMQAKTEWKSIEKNDMTLIKRKRKFEHVHS